jgi:hypothetical protein
LPSQRSCPHMPSAPPVSSCTRRGSSLLLYLLYSLGFSSKLLKIKGDQDYLFDMILKCSTFDAHIHIITNRAG